MSKMSFFIVFLFKLTLTPREVILISGLTVLE